MLRPTLAPRDEPVDAREVQSLKRTEQRFSGDEPDRRRNGSQRVGTMDELAILDRHAHPDVHWPIEPSAEFSQALMTFGQDLKDVPVRATHDGEHLSDEVHRHIFVEEIAHRVDKDRSRSPPSEWDLETLWP